MSFFKKLGRNISKGTRTFTKKTLPKVGKNVGETLKHVGQGLGNLLPKSQTREDRFPELPGLRDQAATLKETYSQECQAYFAAAAEVQMLRAEDDRLAGAYAKVAGRAAPRPFQDSIDVEIEDNPVLKVLKDTGKTAEGVLSFVSFGISGAIFDRKEALAEKEHLEGQIRELSSLIASVRSAIRQLHNRRDQLKAAIAETEAKMREAGLDPADGSSAMTVHEAEQAARRATAARMLSTGMTAEMVANFTGLDPEIVAGLPAEAAAS